MAVIVKKKQIVNSASQQPFAALSQQGSAESVISCLYFWRLSRIHRMTPAKESSDEKALRRCTLTQSPWGFCQNEEGNGTTGQTASKLACKFDYGASKWKSHLALQMLARDGWPSALKIGPVMPSIQSQCLALSKRCTAWHVALAARPIWLL